KGAPPLAVLRPWRRRRCRLTGLTETAVPHADVKVLDRRWKGRRSAPGALAPQRRNESRFGRLVTVRDDGKRAAVRGALLRCQELGAAADGEIDRGDVGPGTRRAGATDRREEFGVRARRSAF